MSGPWDDYKPQAASGPWSDYQPPAKAAAQPYLEGAKAIGNSALDFVKGLPGDINAGVNAAADTATFGYAPQIAGAGGAALGAIKDAATGSLPSSDSILKDYLSSRDKALAAQELSQKNQPISSGLGTIAGAIAAPVPGFGALSAETKLGKVGIGALKGAAIGAVSNPGDQTGKINPVQLDDRLGDAMIGAPLGVAGEGLAKAAEKLPDAITSLRRYFTAKELGANTGQMKQLLRDLPGGDKMRLDRVEEFLNEKGLLNTGKTFSDIADGTKAARDETGKQIGAVYSNLQNEIQKLPPEMTAKLDETALHGPDLANEFLAQEKERLGKDVFGQETHKSLSKVLGTADQPGSLTKLGPNASLPDLVHYRASVDDAINWSKRSSEMAPAEQSYVRLRNFLNDKINARINALDQTVGSANTSALKKLNADYADASLTSKIAEATKAREMAKNMLGFTSAASGALYGGYGMAHGESAPEAIAKGLAVGAAMRGANIYAPGLLYSAARAVEPKAGKIANYFETAQPGARMIASPWLEMMKENK
jgi:hypothetical protein